MVKRVSRRKATTSNEEISKICVIMFCLFSIAYVYMLDQINFVIVTSKLRRECVRRTQMPPPNRKLTSDINEIRLQRTTHDDKAAYQISNYSHE